MTDHRDSSARPDLPLSVFTAMPLSSLEQTDSELYTSFQNYVAELIASQHPEWEWGNEIGADKRRRALIRAQHLSVHPAFQTAVEALRQDWQIEPRLPEASLPLPQRIPDSILRHYAQHRLASDADWTKLRLDIHHRLLTPFGLHPDDNFGLAVAAVCFDLSPTNVIHHWDTMAYTAAKEIAPGARLIQFEDRSRKLAGAFLTIAYLARRLIDRDTETLRVPRVIHDWVRYVRSWCRSLTAHGMPCSPEEAAIAAVHGEAFPTTQEPSRLFIEITRNTTKRDLQRMWPQIEAQQVALYGTQKPQQAGPWESYARDVELTALYDQYQNYADVVQEYDRRHAEARLQTMPGYPAADTNANELVRKAVQRTKRRGRTTKLHF